MHSGSSKIITTVGPLARNPASAQTGPWPLAELYAALVSGIRDYAQQNGFKRILVALSGGIDSALVAALAVEALGAENVMTVSLPSRHSSQHSRDDARDLAANLGVRFETIEIAAPVAAVESALAPLFVGLAPDLTEENIQARMRGLLMMALSNKFGSLLLSTGNKSEALVGYCTLYGDMCGGLAPIVALYKTEVYALSRWINREREIIPQSTLDKPPSAELRPDQKDQDSLPPYDTLDEILRQLFDAGLSPDKVVSESFDKKTVEDVAQKLARSAFKRAQAAPALNLHFSAA
ncbi:hypothetical protein AXK12_08075 [Cephaloticoccus capnophilus]|uniref:NH(3)-dependent NAD(+) synthetase n=1 Tax=Cephaloticoccus capnophilus TaxID=1548208 RepID=A0A139SHE3_9BACT|nr:NAD(+) synthase [Cephaloticoccus capnophilus]KXU33985.1 hypothetical protein AXK12_08075 [Cephaloticoccus capnophilus]